MAIGNGKGPLLLFLGVCAKVVKHNKEGEASQLAVYGGQRTMPKMLNEEIRLPPSLLFPTSPHLSPTLASHNGCSSILLALGKLRQRPFPFRPIRPAFKCNRRPSPAPCINYAKSKVVGEIIRAIMQCMAVAAT